MYSDRWTLSCVYTCEHDVHVKLHPHLYANAKQSMWKWEKCWCGHVAKAQQTKFVYAANVQRIVECYPFGVGISKKNTSAMLGVCLTRQMPNKPLFACTVHLFGFVSVLHTAFVFVYWCGPGLISMRLMKCLRTVCWKPSSVSFFDKHKGCSRLSGYGICLNFCSLPCLQGDFPISPTIFTQLPVVRSWFVIFLWFAGSSWKNKFFRHVRERNVRKCIRSFTFVWNVTEKFSGQLH